MKIFNPITKTSLTSLLFALTSSHALAWSDSCNQRQINAAQFELAQELGVAVNKVLVTSFTRGMWTEGVVRNEGFSDVSVGYVQHSEKFLPQPIKLIDKKYRVSAQQIDATDDCVVTRIQKFSEDYR